MKPPIKQPVDWLAVIKRIQSALNKQESKYTNQLIEAYQGNYKQMRPYLHNIELLLEALPDITPYALKRTKEFKQLVIAMDEQLTGFSNYAKVTIGLAIEAAALLGLASAKEWGLKPVEPTALDVITRFLQPDTALYERIGLWAGNARDNVIKAILEGVSLGKNPVTIGHDITRAFGVELTDAIRASRTTQLWAHREATRLGYIANGINYWCWYASLDEKTCGSCLSLHGKIFPSTEVMDDHYNGRCTMIPATSSLAFDSIVKGGWTTRGEDYFKSLSEAQQDKSLGIQKAQVLREGRILFDQLSKQVDDAVYGTMRVETPLKDLVND